MRKSTASSTRAIRRAKDILTTRQSDLNVLARGLLEYETLTGDEIIALLKGIPPVRTPYEDPVLPARGEGTSVPVAGKPRPAPIREPGSIVSPVLRRYWQIDL